MAMHVLENDFLEPAFGSAFTALFGALAYKYFVKDAKLVPVPLVLCLILQFRCPLSHQDSRICLQKRSC